MSTRLIPAVYVVCSVAAGMVVIGKHARLAHAVGIPDAVAMALLLILALPPLLYPFLLRLHRVLAPVAAVGMIVAVVGVQPSVLAGNMRKTTSGSDQGECITIGVRRLFNGDWPYDATKMSKGNPMSCGPDWLVAHTIAAFTSYSLAFLILLIGSLATIGFVYGITTASQMLLLLALTPVTWLSLINGSDFLTFGVCTAAVAAAAGSSHRLARALAVPASILLAHFRFPFLGLPAAIFLRRNSSGRLTGIWVAAGATAVSVAAWWIFYSIDPVRFVNEGPMHVVRKLEYMSGTGLNWILAIVALIVISALLALLCNRYEVITGTLVFCAAILVPMTLANLYQMGRQTDAQWEGALWLQPLIALAALVLAIRQTDRGRHVNSAPAKSR